ncbi:hypothetical protein LTR37_018180 [Vermiconidia calcicola]|uniref:Uncharacterized protein n=1 Tax=Vermiconidia calcicola TaxID=1690605 RepID=A0ACC3MHN5_9PEZI|nr:hypothetical protein LTR37_018180 [Vermiconidia calcicola]
MRFGVAILQTTLYLRVLSANTSILTFFLNDTYWGESPISAAAVGVLCVCFIKISSEILLDINTRLCNLNNGIPGESAAKLAASWKLRHMRENKYTDALRGLHIKFGALVQVGPHEYSLCDDTQFFRFSRLKKVSSPYSLAVRVLGRGASELLVKALSMANIFTYEPIIDQCNGALLQKLVIHAQLGEEVDLADLISRYAFDTLFATSTGRQPGFLTKRLDHSKISDAIKNWKFRAVAFGTYMRFNAIIAPLMRRTDISNLERYVFEHLNMAADAESDCAYTQMIRASGDSPGTKKSAREACAALVLAGSDPAITHILSSLTYIYRDREILDLLRAELAKVKPSQPPTLKELSHRMPQMPVLHAVLRESLRLRPPYQNGFSYVSPEGGVAIGEHHVPQGCTICLEPTIALGNNSIFGDDSQRFNPRRWLADPALARKTSFHLVSYGASTSTCPAENYHTAIISKLLTQIITTFDFTMAPVQAAACLSNIATNITMITGDAPPSTPYVVSDDSVVSKMTGEKYTALSFSDVGELEKIHGHGTTNALISRFDPNKILAAGPLIETAPIENSHDRFTTHKIIERVWGSILMHETSTKTKQTYIFVPGSRLPGWLNYKVNRRQSQPAKADQKMPARNKPAASAQAPKRVNTAVRNRPAAPVERRAPTGWNNFAVDAPTAYQKVIDDYVPVTKPAMGDDAPSHKVKETFKQTVATKKTVIDDAAAEKAPEKPAASRALPPHLRAKGGMK